MPKQLGVLIGLCSVWLLTQVSSVNAGTIPVPPTDAHLVIQQQVALSILGLADTKTGTEEPRRQVELIRLLSFTNEVVMIPFGEHVREPFILNGKLRLTGVDNLIGTVMVRFPDGTQGKIRFLGDTIIARYGRFKVDLLPDRPFLLKVNGSAVSLTSVAKRFNQENDFTGIGSLSGQSRALLLPVALGSAPAWLEFINELRSTQNEPSVKFRIRIPRIIQTIVKAVVVVVFPVPTLGTATVCAFCRSNPDFNSVVPIPGIGVVKCKDALAICDLKSPSVNDVIREISMLGLEAAPGMLVTADGVDAIFLAGRTDVLPIPLPNGDPNAFILKRHNFLVPEFPLTEELPPSIPIAEGARVRVASPATGGVSFFPGFNGLTFGPDGNGVSGSDLSSVGGISGYKGPQGPLAGVFLDDSIPSVEPAPATLDFTPTGLGTNFDSLSPALEQVFFIGDGFRDDGNPHTFIAPSGATRLVLGIPDGGGFVGVPGFYEDNNGAYMVRLVNLVQPPPLNFFEFSSVGHTSRNFANFAVPQGTWARRPGLTGFFFNFDPASKEDNHLEHIEVLLDQGGGQVTYRDEDPLDARQDLFQFSVSGRDLPAGTNYRTTGVRTSSGGAAAVDIPNEPGVVVLTGFRFKYRNGDHHMKRIEIRLVAGPRFIVNFRDQNTDDPFDYEILYALVPASAVANQGTIEGSNARGVARVNTLAERLYIQGFVLNYVSRDHHIDEIGVKFEPRSNNGALSVWYNDKNDDDGFNWSINFVQLD